MCYLPLAINYLCQGFFSCVTGTILSPKKVYFKISQPTQQADNLRNFSSAEVRPLKTRAFFGQSAIKTLCLQTRKILTK